MGCNVVFVENCPAQYQLLKSRLDRLRDDPAESATFFEHCGKAFDRARKFNMLSHKALPLLAKASVLDHSTFVDARIPLAELCLRASKDIAGFLEDGLFSERGRAKRAKHEARLAARGYIEEEAEVSGSASPDEEEESSSGSSETEDKGSQSGELLPKICMLFPFNCSTSQKMSLTKFKATMMVALFF